MHMVSTFEARLCIFSVSFGHAYGTLQGGNIRINITNIYFISSVIPDPVEYAGFDGPYM